MAFQYPVFNRSDEVVLISRGKGKMHILFVQIAKNEHDIANWNQIEPIEKSIEAMSFNCVQTEPNEQLWMEKALTKINLMD
jgi:hypothetical protein